MILLPQVHFPDLLFLFSYGKGNPTHYSKSRRGGCSDCGFAWLDLKVDVPPLPLPLPLPLPTALDGGGASFIAVCSFLLEPNMDPRSVGFVWL
jgi:hypothetical protein